MLQAGTLFERYKILSQLGAGGMGEVYQARDTLLARTVALKVLKPGLDSKRLLREAQATAALRHPNAVAIFDIGEENGMLFLVMELLQGRTLSACAGDATVTLRQKIEWLMQVGSALAAAHDIAVVHRDIKPENIFITTEGVAKVLDFGLARAIRGASSTSDPVLASLTAHQPRSMSPGTPLYMAPEQFKNAAVDGRTDQFALALVAYELLSGVLPWDHDNNIASLVAHVLMAPAPPLSGRIRGLPPELDAPILRALSKDPAERFVHMNDFIAALDRAVPAAAVASATQVSAGQRSVALAVTSLPTASPFAPRLGADRFLALFASALAATAIPPDATEGEIEAFFAHRVFDVADAEKLHCSSKERKGSGRVGTLASRPGMSRHQLEKVRCTYAIFRDWEHYSLPVVYLDRVSGASEEEFLDELWKMQTTFAELRISLVSAPTRADADRLVARLREEAITSSWYYPPCTDDLLLLDDEEQPYLGWRAVRRLAGSTEWEACGELRARYAPPEV